MRIIKYGCGLTVPTMEHLGADGFEVATGFQQFRYMSECGGSVIIAALLLQFWQPPNLVLVL